MSNDSYTVKTLHGCRIIDGPVPINDIPLIMQGFSSNAIVAADIASKIGATFVIGEPKDIGVFRESNPEVSQGSISIVRRATLEDLPITVIEWLVNGPRGASSEAMFQAMFGAGIINKPVESCLPGDSGDLWRCFMLLKAAGADNVWRISRVRKLSAAWDALIEFWVVLEESFIGETGSLDNNFPAAQTNALLWRIIASKR